MTAPFPIESVRSQFTALHRTVRGRPLVYFDGPGGTQMADQASEAMLRYIHNGMANLHGAFPTSQETDELLENVRGSVANLLNSEPQEIAFGPNMTTLAFSIARALSERIAEGDEIVVTELDHRANVDPWRTLAEDRGATVKFIPLDPETHTLDLSGLDEIITEKTKIVAAGMSSNVTGTITDLEPIIQKAKSAGALVILDAVHAVPHIPVDFKALGADILLCSAYKFFGPHVGIAAIREELFSGLNVYKLVPSPGGIPYKLETGTQNHEGIAGLGGALSFLERLGEGDTQRERYVSALERIEAYEQEVTQDLEEFFRSLPGLVLYRAGEEIRKTPTFAFRIEGAAPREIAEWLGGRWGICVGDSDFYASTMADVFGVRDTGGWVRIGLAPYNTAEEVERFKAGLMQYLEQRG
ncbi:cysteine desulfurase-like protein [Indiicoccus explosivorum]|uniref:cysteine desulfurase-like protein n=1 Tax=Indiicoccus explosivorum TaxID=1917864 RepID=UPI001F4D406F|nr:cysteine desulfurase-like protein [Indiicoccus explosivorum]